MRTRIIFALAIIAALSGSGGRPAPVAAERAAATICSTLSPARVPSGAALALLMSRTGAPSADDAQAVQVCLLAAGAVRPLYGVLPTGDVAVSADGRALAYRDPAYRIHLVRLPGGAGRVIGRGVLPQFSHDGRYLAFVTGDALPAPSPTERLVVYNLAARTLTRLGPLTLPRVGDWQNLFAWAPRADTLAWSAAPSQLGDTRIVTLGGSTPRTIGTLTDPGISSKVSWSGDGRDLLYWRLSSKISPQSAKPPRFSLMRWTLPHGPATALVSSVPVGFVEGVQPPPASDATGTWFASPLGPPRGGLNRVILYTHGHAPRAVALPGEPRQVTFAPSGAQLAVIWTPPYGQGFAGHAALVDTATGSVRELGPAVGAFWIRGTP